MSSLSIRRLTKSFEELPVVDDISIDISDGEFVAFVGPSGCGKSTTLRMIAGLEQATDGDILIGDERVNEISPGGRDIAMVFQNYALYPHMTVKDNIAFGLRQNRVPKAEIEKRVTEVAGLLDIGALLKRKPRMLSGGQRQRVAMGRAIVRQPRLFLFDEPLSNLDAKLRTQMRIEIKRLHQLLPTTTVYVTHDQTEAMTMADRIVVMRAGKIEQIGKPNELYTRPSSAFVASFIGSPQMNLVEGTISSKDGGAIFVTLGNGISLKVPPGFDAASQPGRRVLVGLRPEHLPLKGAAEGPSMRARVELAEPLGSETFLYVDAQGINLTARLDSGHDIITGAQITLGIIEERMNLFDPESGTSLFHSPQTQD